MNWIKLTKENLPDGEVLCCANNDFIVGNIYESKLSDTGFAAENDGCIMYGVTHFCYITLPKGE